MLEIILHGPLAFEEFDLEFVELNTMIKGYFQHPLHLGHIFSRAQTDKLNLHTSCIRLGRLIRGMGAPSAHT